MTVKIGINGLGRIGRMIIRSLIENNNKKVEIKHINSRSNSEVISSLLNSTLPSLDFKFPAIKLNKVLLPEPLGPIIPVIEPFFICSEQFDTAASPPKYFVRLSTFRISGADDIKDYTLLSLLRILLSVF